MDLAAEAERGGGVDGSVGFVGDAVDGEDVGERGGGRLIDEDRLAFGDGAELFQVGAAVDAFEHERVALFGQLVERVDDFDALLFQFFDVARHAIRAFFGDVGAAAGEGGDDFDGVEWGRWRPGLLMSLVKASTCEVSQPTMPARMTPSFATACCTAVREQ